MTDWTWLDQRPLVIAIAGPNGAGKTTFYESHLSSSGLRFVNADRLSDSLGTDPYVSAAIANQVRHALIQQQESFIFETVFSDPVGEKLAFLREAALSGYTVALIFIGLEGSALSEERVAMRVSQGGHDVPVEKLRARYPRCLANLKLAIHELPNVLIYDNSDLSSFFKLIAIYQNGSAVNIQKDLPIWFNELAL